MKALYFEQFGEPGVLQSGEVADPVLRPKTVLIKLAYAGLNFADIYRRRGNYHIEPHTPYINGYEGIGHILAVGAGVTQFQVNDRVLFVDVPLANAELVCAPVEKVLHVPDTLTDEMGAGIGLQGLTADFLAHDLAQNNKGDRVLVHGISGGVGQLLAQMLVADGISVYGITSSPEKQQLAYSLGATEVSGAKMTGWIPMLISLIACLMVLVVR